MRTTRTSTLRDYQRRILRVLVHIQSHLDEDLGLEVLARIACFSPYHFHRVFRGMVGESVKDHVRRLRLERAAHRLKLGSGTVLGIALEAGYGSHEAFTRSFRTVFGAAPSEYRRLKRPRNLAVPPSMVIYRAGKPPTTFKPVQEKPGMKVTVVSIKSRRVAFLRHVGPYSEVGRAWDRLLPYMGKEGFLGGDTMFIGLCHDDPDVTPSEKVRYDACVTMDETFTGAGEIGIQRIAGGTYAVTTHIGPYHQLGAAYTRLLGEWLPRSGRELRSCPCFEAYLNDPQSTDPEDLITDIYAPLKPQRGVKPGPATIP